jgi:hypothetical protein
MPRPHKNTPAIIYKPTTVSVAHTRPSLGQTMKEGFGLGVGVSLAQHAVNGVMNFLTPPKSSNVVENTKVQEYAQNKDIEYEKCMKYSSNDTEFCKTLLDN